MDAYADALGIADKPAKPASEATKLRSQVSGDMGADPAALSREIAAIEADLAKPLDATSKGLLQAHLTDLRAQQSRVAAAPAEVPKADPYADALGIGAPAPQAVAAKPVAAPVAAQPAPASRVGTASGSNGATASTSPEADLTAHVVSSVAAPIGAGVSGGARFLWELVKGNGLDKAASAGADTASSVQDALTYHPRTEMGQKMGAMFDSPYNPVTWIPRAAAWTGDKAGGALTDAGAPGAGAVVNGALNAGQVLLPGAAKPAVRRLGELVKPQEAPVQIEPTMDAPKPRYKLGPGGQPVLIEPTIPRPGSGGAAEPVPVSPSSPAPVVPKPTLAQASPELQQVVQTAQAKGRPLNQPVLDRHLEADTLPVKVQLTEGQAKLDPELISLEMNGRGKAKPTVAPEFYNQQGKALAQNLDVLREKASPNVTGNSAADHGQVLVDEYKAMDAASKADIRAKYKALEEANGGSLPLSGSEFVTAADAALAKINRARFLPGEVKTMLNDYREGGSMTFNDFENLRTILAAEGRKAARAGDGNAEAAISAVRESLESLPMSQETSAIKPLADAARKAAAARFAKIKADPAYKAVTADDVPAGEPSPLADKFVQNYIVNGKGAHVKNMKANLGGSPVAGETISRASLDYLADMAKADKETGKFLADRYNTGVRQLGPKLGDVFDPETRHTVEQLGRVAKYTSAQPKGSYVNNSNTLVGAAAEATKNVAEGVVNNAAFGVPIGTFVRKGMQYRAETKAAKKATAPGAGIESRD